MLILSVADVAELHERIIKVTGGSFGIRDLGLLESAVIGCYQSFGGVDLYPTVIHKAARIAYAICKNHPFIDGNKRTAVTSMLVLLRMNDIALSYSQHELVSFALGVANDCIQYEDIITWLSERRQTIGGR
jgi:death-on-curing protein